MSSGTFVNKNHSVGLSQYHLEWCPKYRFPELTSVYVKEFLIRKFNEIGEQYGMRIHTTAIGNDHVHVFASIPVTMTVEKAVHLLKGISSHELFRKFPSFRFTYYGGHFWSRGYFFRSVSNITSQTVKTYIENQQHTKLAQTMSQKQLKLEIYS